MEFDDDFIAEGICTECSGKILIEEIPTQSRDCIMWVEACPACKCLRETTTFLYDEDEWNKLVKEEKGVLWDAYRKWRVKYEI